MVCMVSIYLVHIWPIQDMFRSCGCWCSSHVLLLNKQEVISRLYEMATVEFGAFEKNHCSIGI